ncbi:TetR/AcrR family transcriptional regulator [Rhodococcus sp. C26F]
MRDTRQHILETSATVFSRMGYTQATIGDIAEAAGVTRPTVYAHFTSKDDVFRALAESVREEFLQIQNLPPETPHDEVLRTTLTNWLDSYVRNLGILTVMSHQAIVDPQVASLWESIHSEVNQRHRRFLERLVEEGKAQPSIAIDDLVEVITGVVMRFAELIVRRPKERNRLRREIVRVHIALSGIQGVEENADSSSNTIHPPKGATSLT